MTLSLINSALESGKMVFLNETVAPQFAWETVESIEDWANGFIIVSVAVPTKHSSHTALRVPITAIEIDTEA